MRGGLEGRDREQGREGRLGGGEGGEACTQRPLHILGRVGMIECLVATFDVSVCVVIFIAAEATSLLITLSDRTLIRTHARLKKGYISKRDEHLSFHGALEN